MSTSLKSIIVKCDFSGVIEDAIYNFFHCRKLTIERHVFNDTVRVFQPLRIKLILCDNNNWSIENNKVLFRAVQQYIHTTNRFEQRFEAHSET